MNHEKAITEVLNCIFEVSQIEKGDTSEEAKARLINYKAESLLERLKSLREEDEKDAKEK